MNEIDEITCIDIVISELNGLIKKLKAKQVPLATEPKIKLIILVTEWWISNSEYRYQITILGPQPSKEKPCWSTLSTCSDNYNRLTVGTFEYDCSLSDARFDWLNDALHNLKRDLENQGYEVEVRKVKY